jgi:hypothetical protein
MTLVLPAELVRRIVIRELSRWLIIRQEWIEISASYVDTVRVVVQYSA